MLNDCVFFRESPRSSKAKHSCPASRYHRKAPPASAPWSQQVRTNSHQLSHVLHQLSLVDLICSLCFLCVVSVCVYVNKHGNCGPHLDRKLMQHLPDHFGPGPVNAVLQQVVQSCIDCAYQPKVLLSALQTHSGGGEIVRGKTHKDKKKKHHVLIRGLMRPIKHALLHHSENRWWSSCGQTPSSLQCFFCAAVLGDDVSSPAM